MLSDTDPNAEKVQLDLIRRMSVAQRLARARDWTRMVVHLSREGLAKANPGLGREEIDLLWVENQYGRELAGKLRDYLEKRRSRPSHKLKATQMEPQMKADEREGRRAEKSARRPQMNTDETRMKDK
jgi:hypothetical protein